jgi:long-chain acyl-CoA synthetase
MDLRRLTARMAEQNSRPRKNQIITFERGQVVRRSHDVIHGDVMAACARLMTWGVRAGMRVGIFAPNCYEWIVYDLALLELHAISVAFTEDFESTSTAEVIQKYSLSLLLLSRFAKMPLRESVASAVAFIDAENHEVMALNSGTSSCDDAFENIGFAFSSGSSGRLKGLSLSRKGIEASVDAFTLSVKPRPDDCLLLFLPISNFQQRLMYYSALWYGFDLIVTDPTRLFRALKDLSPTILIAPPMFYEAIETRFLNLPAWKHRMARVIAGLTSLMPGKWLRQAIARAIFMEVYSALGGRMRFMVTGMAPIKRSTLELFRLMQLPLFETYGMIEFGGIALNVPGGNKMGSVGRLLPGVRVELAADGEVIAIREYRIASTYFECNDGEVEQTFIASDRVATGDIGRFDSGGYLYLVGRKREMIITSGGTKIHPEILEAEIDGCPDVACSVVLAEAGSSALAAVIVPRNADEATKMRIEQFVNRTAERRPSSVAVQRIIFSDVPFTRENQFLRPNLKLDRKRIAQHFLGIKDKSSKASTRSA